MDREAWWATVQGHEESNTIEWLTGFPLWLSWWRICLQCARPGFDPWDGKIPWRRERLPPPVFWPENSMDCIVRGVAKSQTQWATFIFTFRFYFNFACFSINVLFFFFFLFQDLILKAFEITPLPNSHEVHLEFIFRCQYFLSSHSSGHLGS